jgi:hypothetical protein
MEPGTSGSLARNSDHYTTEAVLVAPLWYIKDVVNQMSKQIISKKLE